MDTNIKLVSPEDVLAERESIDDGLHISEFEPNDDIVGLLRLGRGHIVSMLTDIGFKGFTFIHPRYGHKVYFFAKKNTVIMVDYHDRSAMVVEILNEEEREWFLESVEEHLGPEELKEIKNG